jgi:hypothetical protein
MTRTLAAASLMKPRVVWTKPLTPTTATSKPTRSADGVTPLSCHAHYMATRSHDTFTPRGMGPVGHGRGKV